MESFELAVFFIGTGFGVVFSKNHSYYLWLKRRDVENKDKRLWSCWYFCVIALGFFWWLFYYLINLFNAQVGLIFVGGVIFASVFMILCSPKKLRRLW